MAGELHGAEAFKPPGEISGNTMRGVPWEARTIVVQPQGGLQACEVSAACWDDMAAVQELSIEGLHLLEHVAFL